MSNDPSFQRASMIQRLEDETFDVLVVGAGITGAGVALDAATRGLKVALVERDDFAAGTSSKSSKMIHGGLRYLQQGDVKLVRQALHERQRLFDNAPHLVTVLPFMIPILTKDGVVSKKISRALGSAMWMYDATGGWRIGKLHRRLKKGKAFAHLPTMHQERLASAYLYFDAGADDARVVLTLCRTAAANGAVVANRCGVTRLTHGADGRANGAVVRADGRDITVRAATVVNAAGVWSDDVRALDEGTHPDTIRPAKGVHVTVPWEKVRCDIAVVIPVPKDRRSLFLVPWGPKPDGTFEHAYIGTTDTDYNGSIDDPQCTKDDIDYVLRAVNASLTTDITEADITGVWAGLRPLVKAADDGRTADLSRNHALHQSTNGMFTITGGKLTTYREMAEDTVDAVVHQLGRKAKCHTRSLRLLGAGRRQRPDGSAESHLYGRYGTLADEIRALVAADPTLGTPLAPGQPHLRAEAVYAVRHEMALTVDDVLTRRTRIRLFDRRAAMEAAHVVASLMATELGWSAEETEQQVNDFLALCAAEQTAGASA
jgi:glycerol-3-phosphate dehydrogenase